ncbi:MAG: hypothetical protein LIP06_11565 [Tannerellaceae bacterium]|nr:hypothetical protein [Tannerellaceae bacterium]
MSRREELEKEIALMDEQIKNAPADTPWDVLDAWRNEYDALAFDLNNLYDDMEIDLPE